MALLRQQREEDARTTQQTAALVQMLQACRHTPPPPPAPPHTHTQRAGRADPPPYLATSSRISPHLATSQETHRQLIKSNEHLLAQLQEVKEERAQEAAQYRRNFDELKQTLALRQAMLPPADAAPPQPAAGERGRKGKRQATA